MSNQGSATFQAYYDEPYNAIVQPNRFLYYFRKRWMRELGPLGTSIVIYLRGLCYYNPDKGEKRDICEAKFEEIGEAIGVSRATVVRELGTHTSDDAKKGVKKGDPANPSLRLFVMSQAQFNLTDQGARRGANLYRVRMDDPIHPDDQAHYELLCKQHLERQEQPQGTSRPIYNDRRTRPTGQSTGQSTGSSIGASTGSSGRSSNNDGKPAAQNEPLGVSTSNSASPAAQNEPLGSEGGMGPAAQNESANDLYVLGTNGQTFNVLGSDIDRQQGRGESQNRNTSGHSAHRDVIGELIEARVTKIVEALGDAKSIKRYRQLVGICESHSLLSLVDEALESTLTRQKAEPVTKPGAYFQTVLVRLLEKRKIYVPSVAEASTGKNVSSAIRDSLGAGFPGEGDDPFATGEPQPPARPASSTGKIDAAAETAAEIASLRAQGGSEWNAWMEFVEDKKRRYMREAEGMPERIRTQLQEGFWTPERERSLWREWRSQNR